MIARFTFENIADFNHSDFTKDSIRDFILKALYTTLPPLKGQCVQDSPKSFSLETEGTQEELLNLSKSLEGLIPLTLQWAFKEFALIESFSTQNILNKPNTTSKYFLTPLELQSIANKDSKDFCNLWGDFLAYKQETLTLLQEGKRVEIQNPRSLEHALKTSANILKHGEKIFLKTLFGKFAAILFDENRSTTSLKPKTPFMFMPFSLESAKLIFKTQDLQALATLEKPILTSTPKGVFSEFFPNVFVEILLPFEPYLVLLSQFLEGYLGLYLLPLEDQLDNGICEYVETYATPLKVSAAQNGQILAHTLSPFSHNAELNAFQETILQLGLARTNATYLGKHRTRFLVYFDQSFKEALEFNFESNLYVILTTLESLNATTQSLLKNFTKENSELIAHLKTLPKDSTMSQNLLDLVGMAGVLLDLGTQEDLRQSYQKVLQSAATFMGAKGPRIDFRLERDGNGKISLNTLQTLRSVMSFKLAGVETSLLCFGILDSLAEFFANLSRDMNENYQTQDVVICGEMFLNQQFLNQFLHYLPKTSEIHPTKALEFI